MRVFLSYSHSDRDLVVRVHAALNAAGFDTFLDDRELPPGEEYNARIKLAIDDADLFIFFVSERSLRPGSYAVTELSFAERKWRNPSGYVLPVLLEDFDPVALPAYLRPISALKIRGNPEAEIVGWVEDRANRGSAGVPGLQGPRDRLQRWARLARPPARKGRPVFVGKSLVGIFFGAAFALFGLVGSALFGENSLIIFAVPVLIGGVFVLYSLWMFFQGLRGGGAPVAAVVLDRRTSAKGGLWIDLETVRGKRRGLHPVTRGAKEVYAGDIGWAYIRGGLLIEFVPASSGNEPR